MTTETQNTNSFSQFSKPRQDYNVIKIRLDTTALLSDIESFLRGSKDIVVQDKVTGNLVMQTINTGKAKMNEAGLRTLLNWISATVNSQVVQGNFPYDKGNSGVSTAYNNYIYNYRLSLMNTIIINCVDWDINDNDLEGLIDFVMNLIKPFMSRLIGNKERDSYADTIKTVDSQHLMQKSGGLKFFK